MFILYYVYMPFCLSFSIAYYPSIIPAAHPIHIPRAHCSLLCVLNVPWCLLSFDLIAHALRRVHSSSNNDKQWQRILAAPPTWAILHSTRCRPQSPSLTKCFFNAHLIECVCWFCCRFSCYSCFTQLPLF